MGPAGPAATNSFLHVVDPTAEEAQTAVPGANLQFGQHVQNGASARLSAPDTVTLSGGAYLVVFKADVSGQGQPIRTALYENGVAVPGGTTQIDASAGQSVAIPVIITTTGGTLIVRNESTGPVEYANVSMAVVRLDG